MKLGLKKSCKLATGCDLNIYSVVNASSSQGKKDKVGTLFFQKNRDLNKFKTLKFGIGNKFQIFKQMNNDDLKLVE